MQQEKCYYTTYKICIEDGLALDFMGLKSEQEKNVSDHKRYCNSSVNRKNCKLQDGVYTGSQEQTRCRKGVVIPRSISTIFVMALKGVHQAVEGWTAYIVETFGSTDKDKHREQVLEK